MEMSELFAFAQKNSFPITAICTVALSFILLREQVKQIAKDVNGVGAKVTTLTTTVAENHKETTNKHAASNERIAKIEGILEGSRNPVSLPSK